MKARRYNKGKNRQELISTIALRELGLVYTLGAHKYSDYKDKNGNIVKGKDIPYEKVGDYELVYDAATNWRHGLSWKETMGSVKRHILDWEEGIDVDELGTKTIANAMWGLATLLDYYKTFPQGDDRHHSYLKHAKIGLDIDDVLADWTGHWTKFHDQDRPESWNFDRDISFKFELLKDDKEFWLSIPPKILPSEIPFEPHCYITSRSIPQEWTEEWLDKNGFPATKVYSVGINCSKVDIAKESGIDIFVDDRFENFTELNNNGICCFLFDAPHNTRYNVGYKRITSLKDFVNY